MCDFPRNSRNGPTDIGFMAFMADPRTDPETLERDPFEGTPFRMVQRLSSGGMGDVFVVQHRELGRKFAAKVLAAGLSREPQVMDRLRLEAQALGSLHHPNIVSIVGFAQTRDARPFIVMELLSGRSLAAELRERGRLRIDAAVQFAIELLSALEAAHAIGLVHRDIKPGNLFLAEQPNGATVLKLLDFGIARVLPGAPSGAPLPLAVPTETGMLVGTPRFISPEGAWGARVDQRADLYGAGLSLYAMLAGRGPFDHFDGEDAVRGAHATQAPAPPSRYALNPVPAELDALVLRALEKNPDARFATATAFKEALQLVAGPLARPSGRLEMTLFEREAVRGRRRDPLPGPLPANACSLRLHPCAALRVTPARRPSFVAKVGVFLSGMVVSGLLVAAIYAALRGGG